MQMNPVQYLNGPRRTLRIILTGLFEVDLRGLAVFRIVLGLLLICDLLMRLPGLPLFYTDTGALPRSLAIYHLGSMVGLSAHLMSGELWFQGALFLTAFLFGGFLVFGYKARMAAFVSWFLFISVCSRNPQVLNYGDSLLGMLLLWSSFLPIGRYYSIGDRRGEGGSGPKPVILSVASAALLLQVVIMYWVTAFLKTGPEWPTGDALYYALHLDFLTTPAGRWLLDFPGLLKMLTHASLILEYVGPLLLLYPFGSRTVRLLGVIGFTMLHLGIAGTMRIGLFPFIDIAALIPFIPTVVWDRLTGREAGPSVHRQGAAVVSPMRPWLSGCAAGILLAYISWWALGNLQPRWRMPAEIKAIGSVFRLQQRWTMFAPSPARSDAWCIVAAELDDGSVIDLLQQGRLVSWEKPNDLSASFESFRHRQYIMHLNQKNCPKPLLARYCAVQRLKWDPRITATGRKLLNIKLYFMIEKALPGNVSTPAKKRHLWTLECSK